MGWPFFFSLFGLILNHVLGEGVNIGMKIFGQLDLDSH